jgi:hypothetical protein
MGELAHFLAFFRLKVGHVLRKIFILRIAVQITLDLKDHKKYIVD